MEIIKQYFDEFQKSKRSHGVANRDVYNFDETRFRVGCRREQKIITKEKKAYIILEDPKNRNFIFSLKCVCANRSII